MNDIFNSDLELATHAEIIFTILERAAREGNFGVQDGQIWRKPELIDTEINEYIERQKDNDTNTGVEPDPSHP